MAPEKKAMSLSKGSGPGMVGKVEWRIQHPGVVGDQEAEESLNSRLGPSVLHLRINASVDSALERTGLLFGVEWQMNSNQMIALS